MGKDSDLKNITNQIINEQGILEDAVRIVSSKRIIMNLLPQLPSIKAKVILEDIASKSNCRL